MWPTLTLMQHIHKHSGVLVVIHLALSLKSGEG